MKIFVRILGGSILVIIALTIALFLLQPRIPLGVLSGLASSLLTSLTGSEQVIRGKYFLVPGTWTTFSVEDGSLELTGKEESRLKVDITSAKTTVHLWSLFAKEIKLDGIAAHGITLDVFAGRKKESSDEHKEEKEDSRTEFIPFILEQTGIINLEDITVTIDLPETGEHIALQLIKGMGEFSQDAPGKFTIEAVMDNREFNAHLEGGLLSDLAAEWPFSIHMRHKSVTAEIIGSATGGVKDPQLKGEVSLSGEHFDDLISIFGSQGSKNRSFSLKGTTILSREEISADFFKMQADNETLQLSASVKNFDSLKSQYNFKVRGDSLNLDELKGFITGEMQETESSQPKAQKTKISRDDIIFPGTFLLKNLTLDLELKELIMAGNTMKDIRLNFVIDDGQVVKSPFTVSFKNANISGQLLLKIDDSKPYLSAHLDTSSLDIGAILKELQIVDDIVTRIDNVKADLNTNGRTLGELYENLEFTVIANDGLYEYHDPNTGAVLPVVLDTTRITAVPGNKTTVKMQGKIDDTPISIAIEIDDRGDKPLESVNDISITVHILIAGTRFKFFGTIPLPFRMEGITVHSKFSGERLDSMNELLHLQLPELGPYEVDGKFSIVPEGYHLNGIKIQIGSSSLKGNISVNTKAVPPAVSINLQSSIIQLNDFEAIQLISQKDAGSEKKSQEVKSINTEEKQNFLTDQAVLDKYNASIRLEVKKVLLGAEYLGSGTLNIEQQHGQLQVAPLELRLPHGTIKVDLSLSPFGNDRIYNLSTHIQDLDYGIVARMFKPETDMSGIINLRTHLESASPDLQSILENGSGYIDLSLQPEKLRSGVIDLWAVNLFSYLVPFLAPKGESKINCAAGRFNIAKGILKQDELLIDTSKIQVKGDVKVDFKQGLIDATLRPIPKRPQFNSLSTPIKIHGRLSELEVGIATGGLISTIIRLATSYIVVPLQWIIQNKLPEDGTASCLQLVEERTEY